MGPRRGRARGRPAPVIYEARLYGASAGELLGVVREVPAQVRTLMLIGHNPGVQELVLMLACEADGYVLEQTRTKSPTSAIAVLHVSGHWASLEAGAARLTDMVVPRGAKPTGRARGGSRRVDRGELGGPAAGAARVLAQPAGAADVGEPLPEGEVEDGCPRGTARVPCSS